MEGLYGVLDGGRVWVLRAEAIVDRYDDGVRTCTQQQEWSNPSDVDDSVSNDAGCSRLHILDENEFSVSTRPRVHPPAKRYGGSHVSDCNAYLWLYVGSWRTSVEEDEDWPATRWGVALWSEDTDRELAEGVVLDFGHGNGVRSAKDCWGGANGRVPGNVLEVRSVLNVFPVEISVLLEKLSLDLWIDGLEDGTFGNHLGT